MDLLMLVAMLIVGIVIIVAIAGITMGVLFCGDIVSYTGPGMKTLSPAGASVGKALVVFNPGLSGEAKKAAENIAGDLQSKGYTVNLAGIKSAGADNITGYDVVVAGGPIYWGRVSNSVDAYLNALKPQNGTRIGVFGTIGWSTFSDSDIASIGKQVAATPCAGTTGRTPAIQTIRNGDNNSIDSAGLVSAVLK